MPPYSRSVDSGVSCLTYGLSCRSLISNANFLCCRLDNQIAQLEKEQRDKMARWSEKTEPLDTWLVKNETVVESYEPIGYDINYVKRQSDDAQVSVIKLLVDCYAQKFCLTD